MRSTAYSHISFFLRLFYCAGLFVNLNLAFAQETEEISTDSKTNASVDSESNSTPEPEVKKEPSTKPAGKDATSKEVQPKVNQTKSNLAKKLDNRFSIGTNVGWVSMKTSSSPWNVAGATSLFGYWKTSQNQDSNLYVTGRYTPYAGNFKFNDAYYDATGHAFLGGLALLIPITPNRLSLKLGGETGFMKVYAKPQDGSLGESSAKKSAALFGATSQLDWTFLEKIQFGPFMNLYAGGASILQLGVGGTFSF